jgi:hypothetical protein
MPPIKHQTAAALALSLIVPFAAGIAHAADPIASKDAPPTAPPTIDTDKDGKADAWDRDANGIADAWDVNGDGQPDLFDNDGDGKPDEKKLPLPPADDAKPMEQR